MRLIDADALEKDANEDLISVPDTTEEVYWNDGAKSIIDLIKTAPTIDPVKHGKWIKHGDGQYRCSSCGKIIVDDDVNEQNYCCNCGAKMNMAERSE